MEDLCLHLLDLIHNSLEAGAGLVTIEIREDHEHGRLSLVVEDNGRGMGQEALDRACDPFFTTRTTRRVGLGLSLLKSQAEAAGGGLSLESGLGKGSRVEAVFGLDHIDRQPLGPWPFALMDLVAARPQVDFVYRHWVGGDLIDLDTRELKAELGAHALKDAGNCRLVAREAAKALSRLGSRA